MTDVSAVLQQIIPGQSQNVLTGKGSNCFVDKNQNVIYFFSNVLINEHQIKFDQKKFRP